MEIRSMSSGDKPRLLEMMTKFYASPAILHKAPREVLKRDIDDCISDSPYIDGYVCECDGIVAGYTMVSKGYSTEYGGINVTIEDLYVDEAYRGRGIGGALLRFIENRYRGRAVRLRLEVEPSNVNAKRLYVSCGYEELPYTQMVKELE